jgi:predicted TIM-barrel fold metal-dependent hydrolase
VFDDAPIREWLAHLRGVAPPVDLFDAHTHIGQNDPDEFKCMAAELKEALATIDARAAVFPMHEPAGYPPANDMVIEEASRSEGRLVPFCRLDPKADPLPEAKRALERGARGIKLHPRAEQFALNTPELSDVFALADERRLPVLVHAGRGIPALGRHAIEICERFPNVRLILAHAAICDLAWIWQAAPKHPNLFFDTSWWSASDLLTLYTLVPPRQVLFASDAPYATPAFGAYMNLRYALQAGLADHQIKLIFGGQMDRILSGEEPADAGPAIGPGALRIEPLLDRVYTFLVTSFGQLLTGQDAAETLGLASLACEVGEDSPHAAACSTILAILELRDVQVERGVYDDRPSRFGPGAPMVILAACIARTPDVPMPPIGKPHVDVGERAA